MQEGIAITDPKVFGSITKEQLDHILRSDIPNTAMPLIPERLQSLHQAGQTLCEVYHFVCQALYNKNNFYLKKLFVFSVKIIEIRKNYVLF